jgi:NDP-sugar pyrophosphorylase family protein
MTLEQTKAEYYFKDLNKCPCREAFDNIEFVWQALNKKDSFLDIKESNIESEISSNVVIKGNVIIKKNVKIDPFVVIEGPVIIGENSHLKKGAYIRAKTIIGKNCKIGHNTEIKNTLIFDDCDLSEKNYIGDSIIGAGVWVATGITFANIKLDKTNLSVRIKGQSVDTGMRKLGAIIGDDAIIGSHVFFNPATLVGPNTKFFVQAPRFFEKNKTYKIKQIYQEVE